MWEGEDDTNNGINKSTDENAWVLMKEDRKQKNNLASVLVPQAKLAHPPPSATAHGRSSDT